MSGLFNQPYRRKASPTKKVVISVSILAFLALGFRVYYNNYSNDHQSGQQEKTDSLQIAEHQTDQNTENPLNTDGTDESTSEDTNKLVNTEDRGEGQESMDETLSSSVAKASDVRSDFKLSPIREKRNQTISVKSAIRGDRMGPKNIISYNSQTYRGFKDQDGEVLSTDAKYGKKRRKTITKVKVLKNKPKTDGRSLQPLVLEKRPRKKSTSFIRQLKKIKAPTLKRKKDVDDFLFSGRKKLALENAKLREDIAISEPKKKKDDF